MKQYVNVLVSYREVRSITYYVDTGNNMYTYYLISYREVRSEKQLSIQATFLSSGHSVFNAHLVYKHHEEILRQGFF